MHYNKALTIVGVELLYVNDTSVQHVLCIAHKHTSNSKATIIELTLGINMNLQYMEICRSHTV